jgi:hypothetical protein
MKIEAYESENGKIFKTENEAKIENLTELIFKFLMGEEKEYTIYYPSIFERVRWCREFAKTIVTDRRNFLALFNTIKDLS